MEHSHAVPPLALALLLAGCSHAKPSQWTEATIEWTIANNENVQYNALHISKRCTGVQLKANDVGHYTGVVTNDDGTRRNITVTITPDDHFQYGPPAPEQSQPVYEHIGNL